jgi:hypothetical protein
VQTKNKARRVVLKGADAAVVMAARGELEKSEVVTDILKERRARWELYAKRRRKGGG